MRSIVYFLGIIFACLDVTYSKNEGDIKFLLDDYDLIVIVSYSIDKNEVQKIDILKNLDKIEKKEVVGMIKKRPSNINPGIHREKIFFYKAGNNIYSFKELWLHKGMVDLDNRKVSLKDIKNILNK